jgi:hypothetical protein
MIGLIKLLMHFHHTSNTATRPNPLKLIPDELLKVLVLHGQWLFILSNLVGIPWPTTLAHPLQVINGIWSSANGSSIGLDCILPRTSAIPVAVQRILFSLFLPLAILCVILLGEAIMHCVRSHTLSKVHHHFASLVMSVMFIFLPMWVSTTLSLFTCVLLD